MVPHGLDVILFVYDGRGRFADSHNRQFQTLRAWFGGSIVGRMVFVQVATTATAQTEAGAEHSRDMQEDDGEQAQEAILNRCTQVSF